MPGTPDRTTYHKCPCVVTGGTDEKVANAVVEIPSGAVARKQQCRGTAVVDNAGCVGSEWLSAHG